MNQAKRAWGFRKIVVRVAEFAGWLTFVDGQIVHAFLNDDPGLERTSRGKLSIVNWWEWMMTHKLSFSLPQLAAAVAFAVVLIVAGISGIFSEKSSWFTLRGAQSSLLLPEEEEIKANLERRLSAINERKVQWDSQRRADFEQRMNRIDESLKLSRHMLEEKPSDPQRQELVRALYDEKRQFLEDVERLKW